MTQRALADGTSAWRGGPRCPASIGVDIINARVVPLTQSGAPAVEILNGGDLAWRGARSIVDIINAFQTASLCYRWRTNPNHRPVTSMGYSLAAVHVTVARVLGTIPGVDVQRQRWANDRR